MTDMVELLMSGLEMMDLPTSEVLVEVVRLSKDSFGQFLFSMFSMFSMAMIEVLMSQFSQESISNQSRFDCQLLFCRQVLDHWLL
jgi:hypothetical protein